VTEVTQYDIAVASELKKGTISSKARTFNLQAMQKCLANSKFVIGFYVKRAYGES